MSITISTAIPANATVLTATTPYYFVADTFKPIAAQAVWTCTTGNFDLKLQYSANNVNWIDFQAATNITNSSGTVMWDIDNKKDALYWRVLATANSGQLDTFKVWVNQYERT